MNQTSICKIIIALLLFNFLILIFFNIRLILFYSQRDQNSYCLLFYNKKPLFSLLIGSRSFSIRVQTNETHSNVFIFTRPRPKAGGPSLKWAPFVFRIFIFIFIFIIFIFIFIFIFWGVDFRSYAD